MNFIDNIKQDVIMQTVATQKQLTDYANNCAQVISNIKAMQQDAYQIIDLLILQLMAVAEYNIQGLKLGSYRQHMVFQ